MKAPPWCYPERPTTDINDAMPRKKQQQKRLGNVFTGR